LFFNSTSTEKRCSIYRNKDTTMNIIIYPDKIIIQIVLCKPGYSFVYISDFQKVCNSFALVYP